MAGNMKVSLTLRAFDRMSAPMRAVQRAADRLGAGFRRTERRARGAGAAMKTFGKQLTASPIHQFAANMSLAGGTVSMAADKMRSALEKPIQVSEDFGQKMAEVKSILTPTTAEFKMLSGEAQRLGFEIGEFTMQDAAEGMKIMAMAGRSADDVMKSLTPTLNLSTAAGLDFAETTDIMLGLMGAFKLDAGEAGNVADVLSATFTGSKVDLRKLGDTFRYSAATAKAAGVSYQELSLMTGLLGNSSIDASVAGTTLNQMMLKLIKPNTALQSAMENWGIVLEDVATGKMRPVVDILQDLGAAMDAKGLSDVKKTRALSEIFQVRGMKGAVNLVDALGTEAFEKLANQIDNASGRTAELAKIQRETSKNLRLQMNSALEAMGKTIGDELLPALDLLKRFVILSATAVAKLIKKFPVVAKGALLAFAGLTLLLSVLAPLIFAMGAVATVAAFVMVPAFAAAAAAVWGVVAPIAALIAIAAGIAAVATAAYLLVFRFDETAAALQGFFEWLGLSRQEAALWSSAVVSFFELALAPVIAFARGLKSVIDNWEYLNGLGGSALDFVTGGQGVFGYQGQAASLGSVDDVAGAALQGNSLVNGRIEVVVTEEGKVKKIKALSESAVEFAADVGTWLESF